MAYIDLLDYWKALDMANLEGLGDLDTAAAEVVATAKAPAVKAVWKDFPVSVQDLVVKGLKAADNEWVHFRAPSVAIAERLRSALSAAGSAHVPRLSVRHAVKDVEETLVKFRVSPFVARGSSSTSVPAGKLTDPPLK